MYKAGEDKQLNFLEAEKMVGNIGLVAFEEDASGGKVIEAIPGKGKAQKGEMVYGPTRDSAKGKYTAGFLLRTKGGKNCSEKGVAARLLVSDEKNQTIYSSRKVDVCELDDTSFKLFPVDFVLERDESLSFRVFFTDAVDLQLDAINVVQK